jgi:hypothetical protein
MDTLRLQIAFGLKSVLSFDCMRESSVVHLSDELIASQGAEVKRMVDTNKRVPEKRPEPRPDTTTKPVTAPHNRAEQAADKAAHKAAKTEQEYDQNNTIISK